MAMGEQRHSQHERYMDGVSPLATAAATGVSTGIPASTGQWITLDRNGDRRVISRSPRRAPATRSRPACTAVQCPPDLALSITDGWA
jgi:hypothetical protein